jgi:protein-disulfide isomerase
MEETPRPEAGERKAIPWRTGLIAGLLGVLIGAVAMAAASGYFVRRYLLSNPEVLTEAMGVLQDRQSEAQQRELVPVVNRHRAALETPFRGAWAGAEQPDVVLVEFFDYACGFCRASNPHVDRLLREDPRLRVVWREFPVLGPESEQAAIASMAAAQAGRFRQFHDAMFAGGRPSAGSIAAARAAAGIGEPELSDEMRREVEKNAELARAIQAQGTPTFVVGDQVLQGAVGYEALRDAIADARRQRAG